MLTLFYGLVDTIRKLFLNFLIFIINLSLVTIESFSFYNIPVGITSKDKSKFTVSIDPIIQNLLKVFFLIINYGIWDKPHLLHKDTDPINYRQNE